jgi:15-cis-phytoene synthase
MTPDLDPDRTLALAYVPTSRRPAVAALWALDAALGRAVAGGREPMIGAIKLAWWREALERLDRVAPPAEPVLQALADHALPLGLTGAELAGMAEGWAVLLSPEPLEEAELAGYAAARGGRLFLLSARLLGLQQADPAIGQAGEGWALVDLARRTAGAAEAQAALAAARTRLGPERWPSRSRPLGMLAVLARRDCEPGRPHWEAPGSPSRMLRMLRHRLTGF